MKCLGGVAWCGCVCWSSWSGRRSTATELAPPRGSTKSHEGAAATSNLSVMLSIHACLFKAFGILTQQQPNGTWQRCTCYSQGAKCSEGDLHWTFPWTVCRWSVEDATLE